MATLHKNVNSCKVKRQAFESDEDQNDYDRIFLLFTYMYKVFNLQCLRNYIQNVIYAHEILECSFDVVVRASIWFGIF